MREAVPSDETLGGNEVIFGNTAHFDVTRGKVEQ